MDRGAWWAIVHGGCIISRIVYNMMKEEAWVQYLNEDDPAIKETLKVLQEKQLKK